MLHSLNTPPEKRYTNLFKVLVCECEVETINHLFLHCRETEVVADFYQLKGHLLDYAKEH